MALRQRRANTRHTVTDGTSLAAISRREGKSWHWRQRHQ